MDTEDLVFFRYWFKEYVGRFSSPPGEGQGPFRLKEEHTHRTCKEILLLGEELGLSRSDLLLAETAALFHDVGRFLQWKRHRTFVDQISEDHGRLALKELSRYRVLERLPLGDRRLIQGAIRYHNVKELPVGIIGRFCFFARLLRDADKLDIWRVIIWGDQGADNTVDQVATGAAGDGNSYSPQIMGDLLQERVPDFGQVRNQNDLKLLRLGWVYDLNFAPSCRRVLERDFVELLCRELPQTEEIRQFRLHLLSYLRNRAVNDE